MRTTLALECDAIRDAHRNAHRNLAEPSAGDLAVSRERRKPGIELAIDAEKLYQLMVCGAVSAADFRCLGQASKAQVRDLCLRACAQCLYQTASTGTASLSGARLDQS